MVNIVYIIDTYAWIEYLNGTSKGEKLRSLFIEPNSRFVTLESTLSEVYSHCIRESMNFSKVYELIKSNSIILPILKEHWLDAANIKNEVRKTVKDFGLLDAILIARQRDLNGNIITGDTHFKNMKNVVFIG